MGEAPEAAADRFAAAPPGAAARVSATAGPIPAQRLPAQVPRRLGDLLVERGLLSPAHLTAALAQHRRTKEPLGAVLLAGGLVNRRDLYAALATLWGADLVFVDPGEVDADLVRRFDRRLLLRQGWLPVRVRAGKQGEEVLVATAEEIRPEVDELVAAVTGVPRVVQVVTTDWDVQQALRTALRDELVYDAVRGLAESRPEESASVVLDRRQRLVGGAALVAGLLAVLAAPRLSVDIALTVLGIGFCAGIVVRTLVGAVGAASETAARVSESEVAALADADLPRFTILVPAYKEANVVGMLMDNLAALDYPREKLEILLLLEEDDPETLAAAKAAAPPHIVRFLVVPPSAPKTKPRACNIGLAFARGELVVIYDAEDRPEADQLKKAVVAFAKGGPDVVCVQAALNYFNAEENLLTRMFTLEYSSWFDYTLPGLDRLNLPIPLGGTSNFFRVDALRDLGGWDPYNVTEDADLGIRSAARGGRVIVVNSTTYEEANKAVGNWVRQRSRWIKGYLQTFLVHTRHPVRLARAVGLRQALGFAFVIGGTPASFLAGPPLWALFVVTLFLPHAMAGLLPHWLVVLSLVNLLLGNGLVIYLNLLAVFKRRAYRLTPFALLCPFYWVLHSVAAYKAVGQLVTKPFYWEKTTHGLSTHLPEAASAPEPAVAT